VRILHVVPTYLPAWRHGGPIFAVHGLAKALVARGHEVAVFTTDVHGDGRLDVPLGVPVDRDGVAVRYFPVMAPRRLYRSPALVAALASEVRHFDRVHLHSLFLLPTRAGARAAERAGVPYLVAPRGMLVPELLARRGRLRKRLWIELVERRTLREAAGLHVTSELEAAEARAVGVALPKIFVVPNGIEAEPWDGEVATLAPAVRRIVEDPPPYLLFLGRLSWKKGLDRLLAAFARVPGTGTLVVAGNDDEKIQAGLERMAAALGVGERTVFLGAVGGREKAALLHRAAALVLPSYSENFGNVVLEAWAARTPVVVTPEVGLAATVEEVGGGIVAPGEPEPLAAALRAVLEDSEERIEMGRRGAAAAAGRFSWRAVAARMEQAYSEIGTR
jgi:glycosyltransferase involved in cell wall biosynthesis